MPSRRRLTGTGHLLIGYDHFFIFLSALTTFVSDSPHLSLRN